MAKKPRPPNPGLTPGQFAELPISFGHVDFTPEDLSVFQIGSLSALQFAKLRNVHWATLEKALGAPLDVHQRAALNIYCSAFVHLCVLKPYIKSYNRHVTELIERAEHLSSQVSELISMLCFEDYGRPKRSTPRRNISTAADHFRLMGHGDWAKHVTSLNVLLQDLNQKSGALVGAKTKLRGADGHYELHPLLINLVHLARSTGDELRITSNEYRSETGPGINEKTPLVSFVETVLAVIRSDADEWLQKYSLGAAEKQAARSLILKLLKKRAGNLLKPLREARAEVTGKSPNKIRKK